ncbi:hypothetical protein ANCDUO_09444 [Ancylostoma duodenale]|uniref:Uncharacterized protein n=1 Tax=Ancylostoma duodenale TaxID=51022 RepID=A0A0C2GT42_9BILA|nr:hypothetical protein ANCDUO_09444 [Ancylostoma duodenale]
MITEFAQQKSRKVGTSPAGIPYYNYPHTVNNLSVVVVTCLLYVQYSRVFLRLSKRQISVFMEKSPENNALIVKRGANTLRTTEGPFQH